MTATAPAQKSNLKTALLAGSLAMAMVGMGFAAVPLYRIFCQVTGFGGTTMRVSEAQASTIPISSPQVFAGDPFSILLSEGDIGIRLVLTWKVVA